MRPSGELDIASAPTLAAEIELARRSGLPVVVDLQLIEFMDCTGLKVLLDAAAASAGSATPLSVISPSPQVRRVIEITGTEALLPIGAAGVEAAA